MKNLPVDEIVKSPPRTTYQDAVDAPPNMVAEVVDGRQFIHPRPASPLVVAHSSLAGYLNQTFQFGRGGHGEW